VLGRDELRRHLLPSPEALERRLRIAAGGNRIGIGQRETAVAEVVEAACPTAFRPDQHEAVGKQVGPSTGAQQVGALEPVHPCLVGGDEQVGGRALFDLTGQRRAGGERQHRRGMALCAPGLAGLRECFLQARGGQYRRPAIRAPGTAAGRQRGEQQRSAEQAQDGEAAWHGDTLYTLRYNRSSLPGAAAIAQEVCGGSDGGGAGGRLSRPLMRLARIENWVGWRTGMVSTQRTPSGRKSSWTSCLSS